MSRSKPPSAAEQARRQKQLESAKQDPDPTLDQPNAEDVLGPIAGDVRTLWPKNRWGQPVAISVPASTPLVATEALKFLVNGTVLETRLLVDPANDPTEREYCLPPDHIAVEGVYLLTYQHINVSFNEAWSFPLMLTVDHSPPNNNTAGPAPSLPQELIDNGLGLDYLNSHPTVDVTVPRSSDLLAGDVIQVFWGRIGAPPTGLPVASKTISQADAAPTPGNPLVVGIDSEVIRNNLPHGDIGILYRYVDRTGNLGQPSAWVELHVDLSSPPRDLPPPRVKEATGSANSSTLDPEHARNGATVVILPAAVIRPSDQVYVQWARPGSFGAYRTLATAAPGETVVPKTFIPPHFGNSIEVYYDVFESGVTDPHTSRIHTLRVSMVTGFPAPQCDKVTNNQLNLANVTDYARFTLDEWPFMATDQFLNLEVRGVDTSGENHHVPVLSEYPVPHADGQIDAGRISKADLQGFMLNEGLDVLASVSFDNKLTWIDFQPLKPTLVNIPL